MIVKIKCHFPKSRNHQLFLATSNIQDGPITIDNEDGTQNMVMENGGNWQNRVISVSGLSRNIGEDKSYEISGITVELNDTDRFFRDMMSGGDRYIAGKKVEFFTEDNQLIYTGTVEKWQFSSDAFVLSINDKLSGLDLMVPKLLSRDEFPVMAEGADGASVPIIYGRHFAVGGCVKCWKVGSGSVNNVGHGIYLVADHHCKEMIGVDAYDNDGNAVPVSTETDAVPPTLDNAADNRSYIKWSKPDTLEAYPECVYINLEGKMDGGGALIEDPIDAIKDIITDHPSDMGYDLMALNEAQGIMQSREYKIACVIDDQKNLHDVLVDFANSFDCDFYVGKGNQVAISLLKWSELKPERCFSEEQIVGFELNELPEEIRNKVKYQYSFNFGRGAFKKSPIYVKQSSVDNWGEFYNRNEALSLTYIADDVSAFDVVQRHVIQRKNPKRIANIELPLSEFVGLDISDVIEVQHTNAIDRNRRKYHIRRINIDFLTDVVQVEAVDITTMTGGVFVLGNSQEPQAAKYLPDTWDYDYATPGSEQYAPQSVQRNYGYLADNETGYFSNTSDYGKVLY